MIYDDRMFYTMKHMKSMKEKMFEISKKITRNFFVFMSFMIFMVEFKPGKNLKHMEPIA